MRYILTFCILFNLANANAQSVAPVFLECQDLKDGEAKKCNDERYGQFLAKIKAEVSALRTYYTEDSIYLSYSFSADGSIEVLNTFSIQSANLLRGCKAKLMELKDLVSESAWNKTYSASIVFDIPDDISALPSMADVSDVPTLEACGSYPDKGKKACLLYGLNRASDAMRALRFNGDYISGFIYFKEGTPAALKFVSPALEHKWNDKLLDVYKKVWREVFGTFASNSTASFYCPFEINPNYHKSEKYQYAVQILDRAASYASTQDYLKLLLHQAEVVFPKDPFSAPQDKEGKRDFVETCLKKKGIATDSICMMDHAPLRIDSLLNSFTSDTLDTKGPKQLVSIKQPPVFSGCNEEGSFVQISKCFQREMMSFILSNFMYPPSLIDDDKSKGKVYMTFVVEKDGSVESIKVAHSNAHPLIDLEAIRVIAIMPPMEAPAMVEGKPVEMVFTIPINLQ